MLFSPERSGLDTDIRVFQAQGFTGSMDIHQLLLRSLQEWQIPIEFKTVFKNSKTSKDLFLIRVINILLLKSLC